MQKPKPEIAESSTDISGVPRQDLKDQFEIFDSICEYGKVAK